MKKRILSILLCFAMIFTTSVYAGVGTSVASAAEVEVIPEKSVEISVFKQLLRTVSLGEFRAIMMAEENREDVLALEFHEIEILMEHVDSLYGDIDAPSDDDIYTHEELLETLMWMPAMECSECGEIGGHTTECVRNIQVLPSSGIVSATTISSNQTWSLNGDITLTGTIRIEKGCTLKIYNDSATRTIKRGNGFSGDMFYVEEGATLHINGTGAEGGGCYYSWDGAIVVDGNANVTATSQIIDCSGKLSLRDTVIRNNKGYNAIWLGASGSGTPVDVHHKTTIEITRTLIEKSNATTSAAITIAGTTPSNYTVEIWDSMIYQCTAVDGSAIYFASEGQAQVTMKESIVDDCDTIDTLEDSTGYYGGALRTNGNGRFKFTMQDSILRNCDSWKFGGGIYWNASGPGSQLTVTDCQFLDNSAAEMGGGMFLEGSNMTITASTGTPTEAKKTGMPGDNITGTLIQGNNAPNGGGIAYKCYSNSIEVQVPTTVANFNENVIFDNNTGANGPALAYNLHDTHNYPTNAKFTFNINGAKFTNNKGTGYGGAIYVRKCRTDYQLTVNFNSGTITDNVANNGGAIAIVTDSGVTVGGTFNMKGGTLSNNTATTNGGAVYLQNGNFNMSGGTTTHNAAKNGGAACITEGNFNMSGGTLKSNEATTNGGAVYVSGGTFNLSAGNVEENGSKKDGGAAYVTNGSCTMSGGTMNKNTATTNGGAVYVEGGDFTMTSGVMTENKATGDESNGGGVYVYGGNVVIGVENCAGAGTNHTVTPTDKAHPIVEKNEAKDSGGGIALIGEGDITMYCGNVINNGATNPGRGLNVYMETGTFDLYNGNIGALEDPELVIVGGTLKKYNMDGSTAELVTLCYHHCNNDAKHNENDHTGDLAVKEAYSTKESYFNLPDGEKYWDAEKGYRFFGWTFYGLKTDAAKAKVRDKDDYQLLGTPIQSLGTVDGSAEDGAIHMYALWAPEKSTITYAGIVVDGEYRAETLSATSNPTTYNFEVGSNVVTLEAPVRAGYEFKGWYLYQNEGQNANWGDEFEPVYTSTDKSLSTLNYKEMKKDQFLEPESDGTYKLEMGTTFFGDITLVAEFEPQFRDLEIEKIADISDYDENQTFLFHIVGDPIDQDLEDIDLTVTVPGSDTGKASAWIRHLPIGDYSVKEIKSWSWRYHLENASGIKGVQNNVVTDGLKLKLNEKGDYKVSFTNVRTNPYWLSGDAYKANLFSGFKQ